jgi:hypothetical protein
MSEMLVDLRGVLRGLHEYSVEYALIGAIAMVFYGYVRNTEDLDVVISPDSENLNRVTEWLKSIEAVLKLNPSRPFGAGAVGKTKGLDATVLTTLGQVDVVQSLPGLPEWPQLIEDAERMSSRECGCRSSIAAP